MPKPTAGQIAQANNPNRRGKLPPKMAEFNGQPSKDARTPSFEKIVETNTPTKGK